MAHPAQPAANVGGQPGAFSPAPDTGPESPAEATAAGPDMAMQHPVVHRAHGATAPYTP